MTKLHDLAAAGQSPWLDNLRRDWIADGELARWVERGVAGVTSNPSIFQKAIAGAEVYDAQFSELIAGGASVGDAYWELVITDIADALGVLAPVHDRTDGLDGYVSLEVAPDLAHDTEGTAASALELHDRLDQPNLYVKIPGTVAGLPAIEQVIAAGRSVNVTLLFDVERYDAVIDAYLSGLEAHDGPLGHISSVASFFVSRVDAAVDAQLAEIGTPEALALQGKVAVANAQLAYERFTERFSGPRWEALAARGARVQRPLWASTSTKNPDYPETLYVDTLIGPDTVNTMPEATLDAFEASGTVARTVDADLAEAHRVIDALPAVGVDLAAVTAQLEDEGVAAFAKAFDDLLATLQTKADQLGGG
ncbi:MAG: transaldolase [Acidimicrobiales bacterium]|nr:transaldolase [Acidimicrobiales bacterium]